MGEGLYMRDKTVAPRVWKSWKLISEPTKEHGQVRKDAAGNLWEWAGYIQNIRIKRFVK